MNPAEELKKIANVLERFEKKSEDELYYGEITPEGMPIFRKWLKILEKHPFHDEIKNFFIDHMQNWLSDNDTFEVPAGAPLIDEINAKLYPTLTEEEKEIWKSEGTSDLWPFIWKWFWDGARQVSEIPYR